MGQGTGTAKFDLTLAIVEDDETLRRLARVQHRPVRRHDDRPDDRPLPDPARSAVVADPDRRLSELSLLDDAERRVARWSGTATPRDLPADSLRPPPVRGPGGGARPTPRPSSHAGRALTYRELDDAVQPPGAFPAGRVESARRSRVGLRLDRSLELAVGLLGILKAGGAFVPLDPSDPRARGWRAMLEDAGVAVVLTRGDRPQRSLELSATRSSASTPTGTRSAAARRRPGAAMRTPEHAAYVIFTSGSTGTPRGVVVSHRLGREPQPGGAPRLFGLGPGDRVLQFSPLRFDIAVEEIFPTWTRGRRRRLRERETTARSASGSPLDRTARDHGPRPADGLLARLGRPAGPTPASAPGRPLRLVVVGGEQASPRAYAAWRSVAGGPRPLDQHLRADRGDGHRHRLRAAGREPVQGRRICRSDARSPNVQGYVLDRRLRPVPIGLPGELYIGGMGVGRGYAEQPAADGRAVRPRPVRRRAGRPALPHRRPRAMAARRAARSSAGSTSRPRSGASASSRARWRPPCASIPDVSSAAVVASYPREDGARLDAFVVPPQTRGDLARGAPRFPRRSTARLHDPLELSVVDSLPLTPSGKVDRQALLALAPGQPDRSEPVEPPRDEVEARVAAIWEELLDVRPVGTNRRFFDLGGHSLLAIRMLSRIEAEFGRAPSISSLLAGATVSTICRAAEAAGAPGVAAAAGAPADRGEGNALLLRPSRGRYRLLLPGACPGPGTSRPFYAFQAPGLVEARSPSASFGNGPPLRHGDSGRCKAKVPTTSAAIRWVGASRWRWPSSSRPPEPGCPRWPSSTVRRPSLPRAPGQAVLELARRALTLPLFGEAIAPQTGEECPVEDVALLLRSLDSSTFGLRRLLDRLASFARRPAPERTRAFRRSRTSITRSMRPTAMCAGSGAVLCANLRAAARYAPAPYSGRVVLFRAGAAQQGRGHGLGPRWRPR